MEPRKHVNYLKSFLIRGHISFWDTTVHNVNVGIKLTSLYPLTRYQNLLDILATTWQRQLKNPKQTLLSPISLGFESSLSNQHWTSIPNCFLLVMRKNVYVYSVAVWEKGDRTTFLGWKISRWQAARQGGEYFLPARAHTHTPFTESIWKSFLVSPALPSLNDAASRMYKRLKHRLHLLGSLNLPASELWCSSY